MPRTDADFLLFLSVVAFLGGTVAVSFGGVFNTVLLETRRLTREVRSLRRPARPRPGRGHGDRVDRACRRVAGFVGVPIGLLFLRAVVSYIGQVAAKSGVPKSAFDVFGPLLLGALLMAGLAIAAAGAYVPAQRAARAPIAAVLQTE